MTGISHASHGSPVHTSDYDAVHLVDSVAPSGLTGATAASRYVGGTTSGAPASGTFAVGDFVIDQTAKVWICTVAGSPGTWVAPGSGISLNWPALKPSPPTYDFEDASLHADFAAHSNAGSFTTGHAMTRSAEHAGSGLELQLSAQSGTIYVAHANTDLDFSVGGIRSRGFTNGGTGVLQYEVGIAALDSSGNGFCVVAFNDGIVYFAPVVSYAQSGTTDSWTSMGLTTSLVNGDWWFRLKRVSTTWTAYASMSGRVWDKTFATSTTAYTIAQLHFGSMRTGAGSGRFIADYFHVAV